MKKIEQRNTSTITIEIIKIYQQKKNREQKLTLFNE